MEKYMKLVYREREGGGKMEIGYRNRGIGRGTRSEGEWKGVREGVNI